MVESRKASFGILTMFIWSASPIAFSVGSFNVYWYGVIYALALFISWAVATWVLRKLRNNGINVPSKEEFDSFMFWGIVSVIIGARLGHVLFFDFEYYLQNPIQILLIRNGGLSFHGAIIGLSLYTYTFVKKHNISWKLMADVLSFSGALGVGIGRFANFMNQELYGKVTGSDMGIIFSLVDKLPRYPTQILEAFFEGLLVFWLLFIIFRIAGVKIMGTGKITAVFCIAYSSARFVIELYKDVEVFNYFNIINLTVGQVLSIAFFLFGLFVFWLSEKSNS